MKYCKKCGSQMGDDSRFCARCDWDSMAKNDESSAKVSKDKPKFFDLLNIETEHSSNGHNCRAESVNGNEVRQQMFTQFNNMPQQTRTKTTKKTKSKFTLKKVIAVFVFCVFVANIPTIIDKLDTFEFPSIESLFEGVEYTNGEVYTEEGVYSNSTTNICLRYVDNGLTYLETNDGVFSFVDNATGDQIYFLSLEKVADSNAWDYSVETSCINVVADATFGYALSEEEVADNCYNIEINGIDYTCVDEVTETETTTIGISISEGTAAGLTYVYGEGGQDLESFADSYIEEF